MIVVIFAIVAIAAIAIIWWYLTKNTCDTTGEICFENKCKVHIDNFAKEFLGRKDRDQLINLCTNMNSCVCTKCISCTNVTDQMKNECKQPADCGELVDVLVAAEEAAAAAAEEAAASGVTGIFG